MEWIAGLIILWIILSLLYHKSLAKDSKRFMNLIYLLNLSLLQQMISQVIVFYHRQYRILSLLNDQQTNLLIHLMNHLNQQNLLSVHLINLCRHRISRNICVHLNGSAYDQQYSSVMAILVNLVDLSTILDAIILTILCLATNLYITYLRFVIRVIPTYISNQDMTELQFLI